MSQRVVITSFIFTNTQLDSPFDYIHKQNISLTGRIRWRRCRLSPPLQWPHRDIIRRRSLRARSRHGIFIRDTTMSPENKCNDSRHQDHGNRYDNPQSDLRSRAKTLRRRARGARYTAWMGCLIEALFEQVAVEVVILGGDFDGFKPLDFGE